MVEENKSLGEILVAQNAINSHDDAWLASMVQRRLGEANDGKSADSPPSQGGDLESTIAGMRYQILRDYNEGGVGKVAIAHDQELSRQVALKQLKPKYANDKEKQRLFLFEGEVTGRLEHPNIVPVHGLGYDDFGFPWYAMRLIRGKTLSESIREFHDANQAMNRDPGERSLALRRLFRYLLDICSAVAYAHGRGVIHRDLKPLNVMIGAYGETVLLDWGLAKVMDEVETPDPHRSVLKPQGSSEATPTLPGAGTPAYMAPEQRQGDSPRINYRTDIYLLGAILFEILTGEPPHSKKRRPDPPSAKEVASWVPDALDAVVGKAMQPAPNDRYQHVQELSEDLQRWLAEEPIVAYREQVEQCEQLVEAQPNNQQLNELLASQLTSLGIVLTGMLRHKDANEAFTRAIEKYTALTEKHSQVARYRAHIADVRIHQSRVLRVLGLAEQAEEAEKEAVKAYDYLILTRPGEYQTNLASVALTIGPTPPSEESDDSNPSTLPPPPEGCPDEPPGDMGTLHPSEQGTQSWYGEKDEHSIESTGRFTILQEYARGGMGSILVAKDNDLNREVIIKQVNAGHGNAWTRRLLLKEAQVIAQLEHPNIAQIYGIGYRSSDQQPFLIMKYYRGQTLHKWIRELHESEPLSPHELHWNENAHEWEVEQAADKSSEKEPGQRVRFLLRVFVKLCKALAFAHQRGIVHRDPKPTNVVLSDSGEPTLLDWGLAKLLREQDAVDLPQVELDEWADPGSTQAGQILGTPAYMPPEMARGENDRVDGRSDIFIAGGVLLAILTGEPTWNVSTGEGNYIQNLLQAAQSSAPPTPRSRNPNIPESLDAICRRALAINPDDRYQDAAELGREIEREILND